ncbi:hypothetical protein PIROE2DRAFT_12379 [Piromyces sp. E2]|nr:hypothetical protein PIROE2DRAFT_12379 [Piromyces sp. E2]|eukprot:OUM61598.1 hypothetical protein PIROE2DRAFT_12379 [Piromyces sp. E2]
MIILLTQEMMTGMDYIYNKNGPIKCTPLDIVVDVRIFKVQFKKMETSFIIVECKSLPLIPTSVAGSKMTTLMNLRIVDESIHQINFELDADDDDDNDDDQEEENDGNGDSSEDEKKHKKKVSLLPNPSFYAITIISLMLQCQS